MNEFERIEQDRHMKRLMDVLMRGMEIGCFSSVCPGFDVARGHYVDVDGNRQWIDDAIAEAKRRGTYEVVFGR
jgi:hypothetical protein